MKPSSVGALASTDSTIRAGGSQMAGGASPNMRVKKDTKIDFDTLHTRVLAELGRSPRGLTADQLLQALIEVGGDHLGEVVRAAMHSR